MLAELETQFSFTNSNEIPIIQSMGISSNQLCLFDGHTLNGSDGTTIDISNRIAIAMFNRLDNEKRIERTKALHWLNKPKQRH